MRHWPIWVTSVWSSIKLIIRSRLLIDDRRWASLSLAPFGFLLNLSSNLSILKFPSRAIVNEQMGKQALSVSLSLSKLSKLIACAIELDNPQVGIRIKIFARLRDMIDISWTGKAQNKVTGSLLYKSTNNTVISSVMIITSLRASVIPNLTIFSDRLVIIILLPWAMLLSEEYVSSSTSSTSSMTISNLSPEALPSVRAWSHTCL